MTYVVAFLYSVAQGGEEAFEREYGPGGEWARFFAGAEGYVGTQLHRGVEEAGRYLVLARWTDDASYRAFLTARREEYEGRGRAAGRCMRPRTGSVRSSRSAEMASGQAAASSARSRSGLRPRGR